MKFSARFWRLMRQAAFAGVMVAVLAAERPSPAQAQFFFPFFDNRPTAPPAVGLRPRRHRSDAEVDLRPRRPRGESVVNLRSKARRRHESPRIAHEKKPRAEPVKPVETAAPAAPEGPPPVYEPQLLRLSEIMGALAWLQTVCAAPVPTQVRADASPPAKAASESRRPNDCRPTTRPGASGWKTS